MMVFEVLLTNDAARDLEEIYNYIALHDSPQNALYSIADRESVFQAYRNFPRGVYPDELLALGIREYREIFFKPYRIVYRVMEYRVRSSERRRDMQSLLRIVECSSEVQFDTTVRGDITEIKAQNWKKPLQSRMRFPRILRIPTWHSSKSFQGREHSNTLNRILSRN